MKSKNPDNQTTKELAVVRFSHRYFHNTFFKSLLLLAVFFSVAAFGVAVFNYILDKTTYLQVVLMLFIASLYFLLYFLGKNTTEFLYLSRFALVFYIAHTTLELLMNIVPQEIATAPSHHIEMSFYSFFTGYLPYIYFGFRLLATAFFIRSLVIASIYQRNYRQLSFTRSNA